MQWLRSGLAKAASIGTIGGTAIPTEFPIKLVEHAGIYDSPIEGSSVMFTYVLGLSIRDLIPLVLSFGFGMLILDYIRVRRAARSKNLQTPATENKKLSTFYLISV